MDVTSESFYESASIMLAEWTPKSERRKGRNDGAGLVLAELEVALRVVWRKRSYPRLLKELFERCLVRRSILDFSQTDNRTFTLPPFRLTFNFKKPHPAAPTHRLHITFCSKALARGLSPPTAPLLPRVGARCYTLPDSRLSMSLRKQVCGSPVKVFLDCYCLASGM